MDRKDPGFMQAVKDLAADLQQMPATYLYRVMDTPGLRTQSGGVCSATSEDESLGKQRGRKRSDAYDVPAQQRQGLVPIKALSTPLWSDGPDRTCLSSSVERGGQCVRVNTGAQIITAPTACATALRSAANLRSRSPGASK